MKNIIFIAPAGTGKGTQSDKLVSKYGYIHISTGELLREAVANGDENGVLIHQYQTEGKLVPDDLVYKVLENKLNTIKDKNFILDGFPRNIEQAFKYDEITSKINIDLGIVLVLEIDKEEAMKRACGRLTCSKCGKVYNSYFEGLKPKVENTCDECGIELTSRSDDTPESFNQRFEIFLQNSSEIIKHYEEKGLVHRIKAGDTPEETFERIEEVLGNLN